MYLCNRSLHLALQTEFSKVPLDKLQIFKLQKTGIKTILQYQKCLQVVYNEQKAQNFSGGCAPGPPPQFARWRFAPPRSQKKRSSLGGAPRRLARMLYFRHQRFAPRYGDFQYPQIHYLGKNYFWNVSIQPNSVSWVCFMFETNVIIK